MTVEQHESFRDSLVSGAEDETITLSNAGSLTAHAAVESYVLGGTSSEINTFTVNEGNTAVNISASGSAGTDDRIIVGGLEVNGTYSLGNGVDTIVATDGANIADVNDGAATTAYYLELTGGITMTLEQHSSNATTAAMAISAGGSADSVTLTTAGALTGQGDVETYILADAGGSTFTQVAGNVSVKSGAGNDLIITSADDATRGELTIDLGERGAGGTDTVRVLNGGSVHVDDAYDDGDDTTIDGVANEDVLNGFYASEVLSTDTVNDEEIAFIGTYSQSESEWLASGSNMAGRDGNDFVTIKGFTAGAGAGFDRLDIDWVFGSSPQETVHMSGGSFFNGARLNATDFAGASSGSVIGECPDRC